MTSACQLIDQVGRIVVSPSNSRPASPRLIDDFHANWEFDRAPFGYIGGSIIGTAMYGGRPIQRRPTPAGTPGWGKQWKDETAKWYDRSMNIVAAGSVMPNRGNYLDCWRLSTFRLKAPSIH
jgi:gluconate 2-dehydrogenase alpha chain